MHKRVHIYLIILLIFCVTISFAEPAKVYFTSEISADAVIKVFDQIKNNVEGEVAIKVHFGEKGNKYFLKPSLVKKLTNKLDATLVETNVLYVSPRRYTKSHIELAEEHGFDFAPIDILNSEASKTIECETKHYNKVQVGKNLDNYDSIIIFSHFKGHGMAGFGGAIKNVSMGLASIPGKMALHASAVPNYDPDKCIKCGRCVPECPGGAITLDPLTIDPEKCIGCGSCIGICPTNSFQVPWRSTERSVFLERLADYAGVIDSTYNLVYINVLANISKSCDCSPYAPEPFLQDIGILASTDIVAIEKASHDLCDKACDCDDAFLQVNRVSGKHQIDYAYETGLGQIEYELINLDEEKK